MKSNTKLIMENWRKFLKEGPQDEGMYPEGVDETGMVDDPELAIDASEEMPSKASDFEEVPLPDSASDINDYMEENPYDHADIDSDELADMGMKRNPFSDDPDHDLAPGQTGMGPDYDDDTEEDVLPTESGEEFIRSYRR